MSPESTQGLDGYRAPLSFDFGGVVTTKDDHGLINLNDLWRAFQSPANKDPRQWLRLPSTVSLIATLARRLDVEKSHIARTAKGGKGGGGGSWAKSTIAIAYAEYVSDEAHIEIIERFKAWVAEDRDPGLKIDRGIDGARRKGWSDDRILTRVQGKINRNAFTDTLKSRGVAGEGYGIITGHINQRVLGGTAAEIKKKRGLPAKAATRDFLETHELGALSFTEVMANASIHKTNATGFQECDKVSCRAAEAAMMALKMMDLAP